jgi:hypothetical protein
MNSNVRKPVRANMESGRMATFNLPKKERVEAEPMKVDQSRPTLERFWLQVDRQTKSTYKTFDEAEKAGKVIKDAFPILQVSIYDVKESQQKVL